MFCKLKIKKELKQFKAFKVNFKYDMPQIEEKDNGQYLCGLPLFDDENRPIGICEKWVNVGYNYHGTFSKTLSNLFPYSFVFKGKKVNSLESIFQGIKLKDKNAQNKVFKYYGINANVIKVASDFDWVQEGAIYWQGKKIYRDSQEYNDFLDEMYISILQNKLYRNVLKNLPDKLLIVHTMGLEKKEDTVFTRYEFEYMLNCLKAFVKTLN